MWPLRVVTLLIAVLLTLISASGMIFPNAPLLAQSNQQTITPIVLTDFFTNPGIGFQAMQNLDHPALPETVRYRRPQYAWKNQNPADGVYDWSAVDADLAATIAQGQQFSFRIYTMRGEQFGGHQIPQWVIDRGARLLNNGEPQYSNCIYQAEWARFVEALRQRYDGNPHLAYIDIAGYGNFNEWSWQNQTTWENDYMNPTTFDGMARKRLADTFIGGAGTIQCKDAANTTITVSYNYPGFQQTQLLMPYAGIQQSSRYVHARRADVGLRHDCLGSPSHTNDMLTKISDLLADTWRSAPIAYELCGVEDLTDALRVMKLTHGSLVHENGGGNALAQLTELVRLAGYRYHLKQAQLPITVLPGQSFPATFVWQNIGFAPAYARMGQNFALEFVLLDGAGAVAQSWPLTAEVNGWLPADPIDSTLPPEQVINQTLTVAANLPPGNYTAAVIMRDTRTGQPINLALTGRDAAGRYPLATIAITANATSTVTSTPTPTFTAMPTPTPMPTLSPTPMPTLAATATALPSPTATATTASLPLIFADGFEAGSFAGWTANMNDGGDLSVAGRAALVGALGMQASIDDNVAIYVTDDSPAAERGYQAQFRFDPNTIRMAQNNSHVLFYGYHGTATLVIRLELRFASGAYQLRPALRYDDTTWAVTTAWYTISDTAHQIELNWRAATVNGANDGLLQLVVDGVQKAALTGIDNNTRQIDRVRLGAVAGLDTGTRGTYYFDDFRSHRLTSPMVTATNLEPSAFAIETADIDEESASKVFLPFVAQ